MFQPDASLMDLQLFDYIRTVLMLIFCASLIIVTPKLVNSSKFVKMVESKAFSKVREDPKLFNTYICCCTICITALCCAAIMS